MWIDMVARHVDRHGADGMWIDIALGMWIDIALGMWIDMVARDVDRHGARDVTAGLLAIRRRIAIV